MHGQPAVRVGAPGRRLGCSSRQLGRRPARGRRRRGVGDPRPLGDGEALDGVVETRPGRRDGLGWRLVNPRITPLDDGDATLSLGECNEKLAGLDDISREDSIAYAARSQHLASPAWARGDFARRSSPSTSARPALSTRTRPSGTTPRSTGSRDCVPSSVPTVSPLRGTHHLSRTVPPA